MHFLCIVYGEDIDSGHLEKSCGVTSCELTLSGPVDQPEVEEAITRTIKQLDATWTKGLRHSYISPSLRLTSHQASSPLCIN